MRRTNIQVELVTPCFLAGADNNASAEWRAASIRGQLRWWFRAVAGEALGGDLRQVKAAEELVFGSTGRRSTLQVRPALGSRPLAVVHDRLGARRSMGEEELAKAWGLTPRDPSWSPTLRRLTVRNRSGAPVPSDPFSYLGFGCVNHKGELARPMIPAGQPVAFEIVWADRTWTRLDPAARSLFAKALWAWLNLGGIGAKSRNGFGSLRCTGASGDTEALLGEEAHLSPPSIGAWTDVAASLLPSRATGNSKDPVTWSRFTPASRILLGTQGSERWEDALSLGGAWLIAFRRRYGADYDQRTYGGHDVAGRDYAWGLHHRAQRNQPPHQFPDRAGFGLPLPFGKNAETVLWERDDRTGAPRDTRRASPLLLHITHVGQHFYPVWTYLPSDPLPPDGRLAFKNRSKPRGKPTAEQRSIVGWFLDDLKTKGLVREVAP